MLQGFGILDRIFSSEILVRFEFYHMYVVLPMLFFACLSLSSLNNICAIFTFFDSQGVNMLVECNLIVDFYPTHSISGYFTTLTYALIIDISVVRAEINVNLDYTVNSKPAIRVTTAR